MQTGEDAQGLRKIIDLTRVISLVILSIHFYIICYITFKQWGFTAEITNRVLINIAKTGLFIGMIKAKSAALLFLFISLIGAKGKKDELIRKDSIAIYIILGLLFYFISSLSFYLNAPPSIIAITYIGISSLGYLLVLAGGVRLSRLLKATLNKDVFNTENETFPQEERLIIM